MPLDLHSRFFESTRGRIVNVLQHDALTVDDIASRLRVSRNAVRTQIVRMELDGLVRRARLERRTTRPSHVFELTPAAQQLLSKAYIPFLTQLVHLVVSTHSEKQFAKLMRETGKTLADDFRHRVVQAGSTEPRLHAASRILNEEFGAVTTVERKDSKLTIRGRGCPLAAVTGKHPAVCLAIETLLAEITGVALNECCTRAEPPQCCFEVEAPQRIRKPTRPSR